MKENGIDTAEASCTVDKEYRSMLKSPGITLFLYGQCSSEVQGRAGPGGKHKMR